MDSPEENENFSEIKEAATLAYNAAVDLHFPPDKISATEVVAVGTIAAKIAARNK